MTVQVIERRAFERPVELRAAPDGSASPGVLVGYAAVFNSESRDLGGFTEVIAPTAFGAPGPLDMRTHTRVMARTNHNSDLLLGTSDAGTLRLSVDEVGLAYEIDLPDTGYGRDLAVLARRGDIAFSSFAFRLHPDGDTWAYNHDGRLVRRVTAVNLVDVAPVADPSYWGATSEMQRAFDLDAIKADLTVTAPVTAEHIRAATDRARAFNTKKGAK